MAYVNFKQSYVRFKVVFYGPALSGKTTNLEYIHSLLKEKTELISLDTDGDRTIFFDYMPLKLGKIGGIDIVYKLYTVPGQVRYNKTRKLVLRDVDGVVFVADAQKAAMPGNLESLQNLRGNLEVEGVDLDDLPYVIQYNKWDLPDIAPLEELEAQLNPQSVPSFTTCATTGKGIKKTLSGIADMVYKKTAERHGLEFRITNPPSAAPEAKGSKPTASPAFSMKRKNPPDRSTERTPPPLHMPRQDQLIQDSPKESDNEISAETTDQDDLASSIPPQDEKKDLSGTSDSVSDQVATVPPSADAPDPVEESDSEASSETTDQDDATSSIPPQDEEKDLSGTLDSVPDQIATIPPDPILSDQSISPADSPDSITEGGDLRSVIENLATGMSHEFAEFRELMTTVMKKSEADTAGEIQEVIREANKRLVVIISETQAGMSHLAKEMEYLKKTVDDFRIELQNAVPNKVDNQLEDFLSETANKETKSKKKKKKRETAPTKAPGPAKKKKRSR